MSILLQLSQGTNGGHLHDDWGSFQIYGGGQQLAPNHAGYDDTFADGTSSESTTAQNGILYVGTTPWNGTGGQVPPGDQLSNPTILAVESNTNLSYAATDISGTYEQPAPYQGNPDQAHTVREFLFIKPLNTFLVIDRLQSTSASVTQSFLLHTTGDPTIVDANDVTYTNGGQEVWLTSLPTLATTSSHSYSVSNEGDGIYRLQDNVTGSADNVMVHAITTGPTGSDPVSIAITGQTATTWTITITSAQGTAILVLNQGTFSLGGSFGYAASGTPVVTPLASNIETMTVTNNGPAWNASTIVAGVTMSAAPAVNTVPGASTGLSALSQATDATQGTVLSSETAASTTSGSQSPNTGAAPQSRYANGTASTVNVPDTLLDLLAQDLIQSKHKKSTGIVNVGPGGL